MLFPPEPRYFPARRALKISLRAVHVLCAGILTGAYVFDIATALREQWLLATVGSGLLILLLDLHESGAFLLQLRGMLLYVKILTVSLLPYFGAWQPWVLCLLVLLSVISSHAPAKLRYFMIFGRGRIRGSESRG